MLPHAIGLAPLFSRNLKRQMATQHEDGWKCVRCSLFLRHTCIRGIAKAPSYTLATSLCELLLRPANLLKSSQFNFAAVCHIVTFLSCSALDIWKSNFLQCCVQLWASKVFIKRARLFWCWGRGDRWKAERSYQGLIKNQLIFINFICHC